jgi:hypothetical protein
MVAALSRARLSGAPADKAADRERVRAALVGINSPATAVAGLEGPIYFDAQRNMPRPLRFGFFRKGRLVSAPIQLVPVDDPLGFDLDAEIRDGRMLRIADRYFWRQHVVYTGIDLNRINRLDVRDRSFNADFYLWMRYAEDDSAVTRIEFPDLLDDAAFRPDGALERGTEDGLTYRLYRIVGNFRTAYDLHDYPFDRQDLRIRFQNNHERRERIAYVIDLFGLGLADGVGQDDPAIFAGLQLWHFAGLRYALESVSIASTLGKPAYFDDQLRVEYPGFGVSVQARRDFRVFIVKTLLPLILLTFVVFATLFFPASLNKERTTIPVTGILASAVLLVSMNNQLPDVGYTVAIESAFYVFFGLALMAMLSGLMHERLRDGVHHRWTLVLDRSAQSIYVLTVLATVALFWWRYAAR